ncbi:tyrosine-type recombinase/integrase, partial [Ralstonia pseudosolanacearum]
MSLYKRKDSNNWYYKLYAPGNRTPVQGSTGTSDRERAQ